MREKYSDAVISVARDNPVVTGLLATVVLGVAWYFQTHPGIAFKADRIQGQSMISDLGKPLGQEGHLQIGRKSKFKFKIQLHIMQTREIPFHTHKKPNT